MTALAAASSPLSGMPSGTRTQRAVRLLCLLDASTTPTGGRDPVAAVRVIRSEKRIQAMDFWMRNPDYLADEVLTMVQSGLLNGSYIDVARSLLDGEEPDLRWYPMPRWLYGAYEALDDAFALLETYGLATLRRDGTPGGVVQRSQFYLTSEGRDAVAEMRRGEPLSWYPDRAALVTLVAGDDSGAKLKERQYLQAEYATTDLGSKIAPISDRVLDRLGALAAAGVGAATVNPGLSE